MANPDKPSIATSRLTRRAHLLPDFLAVVREGGIRQAAEKVHLSQSALTRRIQELEQELGVRLFERSARGMALTKFGDALKHHAQLIELNCNYAVGEINDLIAGDAGELRIAAGPAWAYSLVPDALVQLQRQFPRVNVELVSRMNDVTLPMLTAGRLDMVLGGLPEAAQRVTDIRYEPVLEIQQCVFAGQQHPLRKRRDIRPADLAKYPWAWFAEAVTGREMVAALFSKDGLSMPPSAFGTTSVQSGFRLLQANDHLMLLPSTLIPLAREYRLAPLQLRQEVGRYTAGMMYRESALRLRAFSSFRKILLEQVRMFRSGRQTA